MEKPKAIDSRFWLIPKEIYESLDAGKQPADAYLASQNEQAKAEERERIRKWAEEQKAFCEKHEKEIDGDLLDITIGRRYAVEDLLAFLAENEKPQMFGAGIDGGYPSKTEKGTFSKLNEAEAEKPKSLIAEHGEKQYEEGYSEAIMDLQHGFYEKWLEKKYPELAKYAKRLLNAPDAAFLEEQAAKIEALMKNAEKEGECVPHPFLKEVAAALRGKETLEERKKREQTAQKKKQTEDDAFLKEGSE